MIKANVILDYSKWKIKIKDPEHYLKKKLKKLSKIPYFKKKKQEFSIILTNNKKIGLFGSFINYFITNSYISYVNLMM